MHAFTSTLTALALFVHAWLGCCWHHAHEHCSAAEAGVAPCCDHEHQSSHDEGDEHDPADHQICDEGGCVFLRGKSETNLDPGYAVVADLLPATVRESLPPADHRPGAELCTPHDLLPPLRVHLLYQVLMI